MYEVTKCRIIFFLCVSFLSNECIGRLVFLDSSQDNNVVSDDFESESDIEFNNPKMVDFYQDINIMRNDLLDGDAENATEYLTTETIDSNLTTTDILNLDYFDKLSSNLSGNSTNISEFFEDSIENSGNSNDINSKTVKSIYPQIMNFGRDEYETKLNNFRNKIESIKNGILAFSNQRNVHKTGMSFSSSTDKIGSSSTDEHISRNSKFFIPPSPRKYMKYCDSVGYKWKWSTNSEKHNSIETPPVCRISQGMVPFEGKCQMIMSQGTCKQGHWILLENYTNPKCVTRKCKKDEVYYKQRCVSKSDICGENEILFRDFAGFAYCDCQPEFFYDENLKKCIAEHDQGSCRSHTIAELRNGQLCCVYNPCGIPSKIFNPKDKKCYQKNFIGKCKGKQNFIMYSENSAVCIVLNSRNIFEVPTSSSCPSGSKRDHMNQCRKVFRIGGSNARAFSIPSHYVRLNDCPPGYRRMPNNACIKRNSAFAG